MHKNNKCPNSSCLKRSMTNTRKHRLLKPQCKHTLRRKCVKFAEKPLIMHTSLDDHLPKEELLNEVEIIKSNQWETVALSYLNRLKGLCGLWRTNNNEININNNNNNNINNTNDENNVTNDSENCDNLIPHDNSSDEISINDDNSCTPLQVNKYDHNSSTFNDDIKNNNNSNDSSLHLTPSSNEIEIGRGRAIKIVKSAIEYGLASGVLEQNGVDFTFSNEVQDYINKNTLSLDALKNYKFCNITNEPPLSKNYKLARTIHPKSYSQVFNKYSNLSKGIQCTDDTKSFSEICTIYDDNIKNGSDKNNSDKNKEDSVIKKEMIPPQNSAPVQRTNKRSLKKNNETDNSHIVTSKVNKINMKNSENTFKSCSKIISKTKNRRNTLTKKVKKQKLT